MIAALFGRFWPHIAGGLAIIALMVGIYQAGANAERKRGEAASLRVQIETMQRDARIAEAARERIARDAADLASQAEQNERQIDALQQIIRDRADPGITQPELDGLLNIR